MSADPLGSSAHFFSRYPGRRDTSERIMSGSSYVPGTSYVDPMRSMAMVPPPTPPKHSTSPTSHLPTAGPSRVRSSSRSRRDQASSLDYVPVQNGHASTSASHGAKGVRYTPQPSSIPHRPQMHPHTSTSQAQYHGHTHGSASHTPSSLSSRSLSPAPAGPSKPRGGGGFWPFSSNKRRRLAKPEPSTTTHDIMANGSVRPPPSIHSVTSTSTGTLRARQRGAFWGRFWGRRPPPDGGAAPVPAGVPPAVGFEPDRMVAGHIPPTTTTTHTAMPAATRARTRPRSISTSSYDTRSLNSRRRAISNRGGGSAGGGGFWPWSKGKNKMADPIIQPDGQPPPEDDAVRTTSAGRRRQLLTGTRQHTRPRSWSSRSSSTVPHAHAPSQRPSAFWPLFGGGSRKKAPPPPESIDQRLSHIDVTSHVSPNDEPLPIPPPSGAMRMRTLVNPGGARRNVPSYQAMSFSERSVSPVRTGMGTGGKGAGKRGFFGFGLGRRRKPVPASMPVPMQEEEEVPRGGSILDSVRSPSPVIHSREIDGRGLSDDAGDADDAGTIGDGYGLPPPGAKGKKKRGMFGGLFGRRKREAPAGPMTIAVDDAHGGAEEGMLPDGGVGQRAMGTGSVRSVRSPSPAMHMRELDSDAGSGAGSVSRGVGGGGGSLQRHGASRRRRSGSGSGYGYGSGPVLGGRAASVRSQQYPLAPGPGSVLSGSAPRSVNEDEVPPPVPPKQQPQQLKKRGIWPWKRKARFVEPMETIPSVPGSVAGSGAGSRRSGSRAGSISMRGQAVEATGTGALRGRSPSVRSRAGPMSRVGAGEGSVRSGLIGVAPAGPAPARSYSSGSSVTLRERGRERGKKRGGGGLFGRLFGGSRKKKEREIPGAGEGEGERAEYVEGGLVQSPLGSVVGSRGGSIREGTGAGIVPTKTGVPVVPSRGRSPSLARSSLPPQHGMGHGKAGSIAARSTHSRAPSAARSYYSVNTPLPLKQPKRRRGFWPFGRRKAVPPAPGTESVMGSREGSVMRRSPAPSVRGVTPTPTFTAVPGHGAAYGHGSRAGSRRGTPAPSIAGSGSALVAERPTVKRRKTGGLWPFRSFSRRKSRKRDIEMVERAPSVVSRRSGQRSVELVDHGVVPSHSHSRSHSYSVHGERERKRSTRPPPLGGGTASGIYGDPNAGWGARPATREVGMGGGGGGAQLGRQRSDPPIPAGMYGGGGGAGTYGHGATGAGGGTYGRENGRAINQGQNRRFVISSKRQPTIAHPVRELHPPPALHPHIRLSKCNGRKRGVCIGINYLGTKDALKGCANDARHMRNALIQYFGYHPGSVALLTEDSPYPSNIPTRKNMVSAMKWLVQDAGPNDSLFFHYSGHGGQSENLDGSEVDGWDEVIFPLDFKSKGQIRDDDLHRLMVNPLPPGCRLTALFDSCHSGTVLDLPYMYSSTFRLRNSHVSNRSRLRNQTPGDVISWGACKDGQTSADTFTGGGIAVGAMSWAFISAIEQSKDQTYGMLLKNIEGMLYKKYTQKPQLGASHPMDPKHKFIM